MTFRAYLVEDSSTIRENLTATLRELAHIEPVGTAETEHEAKRWLTANEWDLAIIDLFLREGSGMHVLQAVRKTRPEQRIVVLSNHSSRDVRWRCRQLGADAVFDKSTELEGLVEFCAALAARSAQAHAPVDSLQPSSGAPSAA